MCLIRSKEATEKFKADNPEGTKLKCYKVLIKRPLVAGKWLESPYQYTKYEPGVMVSNRYVMCYHHHQDEATKDRIHYGLHVCLSIDEAQEILGYMSERADYLDHVIVEFEFDIKDLVAVGDWYDTYSYPHTHAVIDKLTLTQEEYDRVTK